MNALRRFNAPVRAMSRNFVTRTSRRNGGAGHHGEEHHDHPLFEADSFKHAKAFVWGGVWLVTVITGGAVAHQQYKNGFWK